MGVVFTNGVAGLDDERSRWGAISFVLMDHNSEVVGGTARGGCAIS